MSVSKPLQRILVVDDDRFIRAAVEKVLSLGGGYTVKVCASGVEAIKYAPDFKPDLLLLDVVMPGLDGPTTLEGLRAMPGTAQTPVAFLTATTDTVATDALRNLGAIGVFVKPFDPAKLIKDLEAAWAAAHAQEVQTGAQQLATELDALRLEYAAALPEEARRLKEKGKIILDTSGSRAGLERIRNAVHSLNGSGASFGFQDVTTVASRLEGELDRLIRSVGIIPATQRDLVLTLLDELEQAAKNAACEAQEKRKPASEIIEALPLSSPASETEEKPHLLIVDDVEAVRRRYILLLSAAGFIVDGAESGEEALNLVRRQHYDLILMDLHMPGMDGFETQQQLRQEPAAKDTPIMFMTATPNVDLGQIQEALAWGVSGFAPKSLPFPQLIREIRSALEQAVQQEETASE